MFSRFPPFSSSLRLDNSFSLEIEKDEAKSDKVLDIGRYQGVPKYT